MVDPIQLEEAILGIITSFSVDDWVSFTIGQMRNRLQEANTTLGTFSDGEVVDCICSLEGAVLIAARKFSGSTMIPFTRNRSSEDYYRHQFFSIGSFQLKITHEGRKVLMRKEAQSKEVSTSPSTADEMDDRLPLYRRKVFDTDIERTARETLNSGIPLALVMIDVDRFKQINDTHGHPMGDEVLLAVSGTISKRAQGKGKAYRYGGEEMAILLPNYAKMEAAALAETIRLQLERSQMTAKKLTVTASFGVAAIPEDARDGAELLRLADAALISAKQRGRNLVRAVGDPDAMEESRVAKRKQPTSNVLTEEQELAIRKAFFRGQTPECPKDGAFLRVKELGEVGYKTPSLLVVCPECGMQEVLSGA